MVVYYQVYVRYLSYLSTLSLFVIIHNSFQRIYYKNLKTKFLSVKMLNKCKFIKCCCIKHNKYPIIL